jgi:hypothetical protein
MENLDKWYKELSKERKLFAYVASFLLIGVWGFGFIPLLLLIYLELGVPKNNINKFFSIFTQLNWKKFSQLNWKKIIGIPLGLLVVGYIITGLYIAPLGTLLALIPLIVLIIIYLVAKKIDKKHQLEQPNDRGYIWGYFQGITLLVWHSLLILLSVLMILDPTEYFKKNDIDFTIDPTLSGFFALLVTMFVIQIGIGILERSRLSLIIFTIFTFNPVIWVINFFYIRRRKYLSKDYYKKQELKESE